MEKLTKQETAMLFEKLAAKYGVLDRTHISEQHDYFYLGKDGDDSKSKFKAVSRVNWMCVYFDKTEKVLISQRGYNCTQITKANKSHDYKMRLEVYEFDAFLSLVKDYLGR